MIDPEVETPLLLSQAVKALPTRPHVSTVWGWATHGINGVRLETAKIGGRRYTSREALARFVARLSGAPPAPLVHQGGASRRRKALAAERAKSIF
jgi:hypothetical protein